MAKKRKCLSSSSTPVQHQNQVKKSKVEKLIKKSDSNGNSTVIRKSTRKTNHDLNSNQDDTIQSVKVKVQSAASKKRQSSVQDDRSNKRAKNTTKSTNSSSEDESNMDIDQKSDKKKLHNGNNVENSDLDSSVAEKSSSDCESSEKLSNKKSTKKNNQVNNDSKSKTNQSIKATNKNSRLKTQIRTKSSGEDTEQHSDGSNEKVRLPGSDDVRRSGRKRKSRFNFKNLVGSDSEDEEEEEELEKSRKTLNSKKTKPTKKEMRQKVKEFFGSDDEDEYRPNDSEQSDEDEIVSADEELSDSGDDGDSNISDVLPNATKKSRFFNNKSKSVTVKQNVSRTVNTSADSRLIKTDLDLSKYKATKGGGCLFNSIGIDSLGNPQADLLKHKIANFKVPSDLTKTVSQACRSAPPEKESVFGGGSCVRQFLSNSHITKHYEVYKNKFIEKTKNNEKIDPKEMMNILTKFETDVANNDQKLDATGADSGTDDDDFEEVEDADACEDFDKDTYRPSCLKAGVTIEVKPSFKPKKQNKNDDWIYDAIRLGINRQRREIFINATKVDILCNLARVKYLNELTFDPEMQALALSIDFYSDLQTELINKSFVENFFDKYRKIFKFKYSKDKSQLLSSREAIRECFETKVTNHSTVYNLILLILFRAFCSHHKTIEENSRLYIAFRPIDSKCDNLLSKKGSTGKANKGDESSDEDEEPVSKSKIKSKSKLVSKSKIKSKAASKKSNKNKSKNEISENEEEEYVESKKLKRMN